MSLRRNRPVRAILPPADPPHPPPDPCQSLPPARRLRDPAPPARPTAAGAAAVGAVAASARPYAHRAHRPAVGDHRDDRAAGHARAAHPAAALDEAAEALPPPASSPALPGTPGRRAGRRVPAASHPCPGSDRS